jgi:hypothetical protein
MGDNSPAPPEAENAEDDSVGAPVEAEAKEKADGGAGGSRWPGEKEFEKALHGIRGASSSKLQQIAKLAMKNSKVRAVQQFDFAPLMTRLVAVLQVCRAFSGKVSTKKQTREPPSRALRVGRDLSAQQGEIRRSRPVYAAVWEEHGNLVYQNCRLSN